jgi:hypothetical protein
MLMPRARVLPAKDAKGQRVGTFKDFEKFSRLWRVSRAELLLALQRLGAN